MSFSRGDRTRRGPQRGAGAAPRTRGPRDRRRRRVPGVRRQRRQQPGAGRGRLAVRPAAAPWTSSSAASGIGDALDEALACERVASVTVAELEPVIVRWFREHGGGAARRAEAAERAGRARIVIMDVADLLARVRGGLGRRRPRHRQRPRVAGARRERPAVRVVRPVPGARRALPGGVAVFWSPERYPAFEGDLRDVFGDVRTVAAVDVIDGRPLEYTMYVARRGGRRLSGAAG